MAYEVVKSAVVPVPREMLGTEDERVLIWLARESFMNFAAGQCLELAEWRDLGELPADEIPPAQETTHGSPHETHAWRRFEGVMRRPAPPSMTDVHAAGGAIVADEGVPVEVAR
ncbi:hypothetical protein ACLQ3K_20160 [Tsukamurella sp. DT100]|uniref:hypothetical protein n=1 Tax=Tsukamurella sp. DT100 TaxID=3393415 RepID=UPI003CF99BEC